MDQKQDTKNQEQPEQSILAPEYGGGSGGSGMDFYELTIENFNCCVNRFDTQNQTSTLNLLINFDDTMPQYEPDIGLHLKLKQPKSNTVRIMPLHPAISQKILIPGSADMTDEQLLQAFVAAKKPLIEHMKNQTYKRGFEYPSVIQTLTLPELIAGRDVIAQFKSGTGKTYAFLYGLLWNFDLNDESLQYVFITSSHEVASQIYEQAKELLPPGARIVLCIGQKKGTEEAKPLGFREVVKTSSLNNQSGQTSSRPNISLRDERIAVSKAQVIVCTMGKFHDYLCNRKCINTLSMLKALCVDEFDNIIISRNRNRSSLTSDTADQIYTIINMLHPDTQRVFFSATVNDEVVKVAQSYFRPVTEVTGEPLNILLNNDDYTLEGINQYYVKVDSNATKKATIVDLLSQCRISQAIIFVNKKDTAYELKFYLDDIAKHDPTKISIDSKVFHGDLSSQERLTLHTDFIANKLRLLISTDVNSRGLDIQSVNLVINYDIPEQLSTYIHRIGRSGRYGHKGTAITLVMFNSRRNEWGYIESIDSCSKTKQNDAVA